MSKSAVERPVDGSEQTASGTLRRRSRYIMASWVRELALLPVIVLLLIVGSFVNPCLPDRDEFHQRRARIRRVGHRCGG